MAKQSESKISTMHEQNYAAKYRDSAGKFGSALVQGPGTQVLL